MYSKIVEKTRPFVGICINKAIEIELVWFVGHTSISSRTFLLRSMACDPSAAADDLNICYTDACLMDMEYYYPELLLEYQYWIPKGDQGEIIFLYEAATVTASILHKLDCLQTWLAIYTDSLNTDSIWNSLKASKDFNDLLHTAIDNMLSNSFDVCVLHVCGSKNFIADALSWGNNSYIQHLVPDLVIHTLQPPCDLLGAVKK